MITQTSALDRDTSMPQLPVLAGDGPMLIHATVAHDEVPQTAPANLESAVIAIRDADSTVKDWRLTGSQPEAVRREFDHWHASFVTEAVVGDVAAVRGLRTWARGRINLSELGALQLPHARISPRHARKLAWQLQVAADECRADHPRDAETAAGGLGIAATGEAGHNGLIRGFVARDELTLLLTDGQSWVASRSDGLVLSDPELIGKPGFTATDAMVLVHGWRVEQDRTVTVLGHEGAELNVGSGSAARLLKALAPGVDAVVVRPAPLTTVFAGLFVTLADLALLAAAGNRPLLVYRAGVPALPDGGQR